VLPSLAACRVLSPSCTDKFAVVLMVTARGGAAKKTVDGVLRCQVIRSQADVIGHEVGLHVHLVVRISRHWATDSRA